MHIHIDVHTYRCTYIQLYIHTYRQTLHYITFHSIPLHYITLHTYIFIYIMPSFDHINIDAFPKLQTEHDPTHKISPFHSTNFSIESYGFGLNHHMQPSLKVDKGCILFGDIPISSKWWYPILWNFVSYLFDSQIMIPDMKGNVRHGALTFWGNVCQNQGFKQVVPYFKHIQAFSINFNDQHIFNTF